MTNDFITGLKKISDHYNSITNLELLYINLSDINSSFAEPRCSFCKAVASNEDGRRACINQRRIFAMEALNNYAPTINICPAGLVVWSIPVYHNKTLKGLLLSGFAVSVNESDMNLVSQADSFRKLFGIPQEDVKKYYPMINKIRPHEIDPLANLLFSLTRTLIDSGLSVNEGLEPPKHVDIIPFIDDDGDDLASYDKPFSFYTAESSFPAEILNQFWHMFESKTTDIFINLMGGRLIEARSIYADIMSMAYREKSEDQIKVSCIHIYHIMTMKFFSKKMFDIRMYRLLNDTIKGLIHAQTLKEMMEIMDTTFTKMCNIYYIKVLPQKKTLINSVIQYIEDNYHKHITVGGIADNMHISAAYLSRVFKTETGFTIKWCLNTIRMNHAQDMLIHTKTPINKIAHAVGYDDMRAFYKMFSKQFGITPSEVRSRYSELLR